MQRLLLLPLLWRPAAHAARVRGADAGGGPAPDFDHLRRSVVRIQAVSSSFDWLHPFIPGQDQVGLGSGFVVQADPYPLFATNAHVVNDAKRVALQLLLYGEKRWLADVVSVCSKFDLALLVLREPDAFKKALASQNITLQALSLSTRVAAMGEDVVAMGFPLGQDALKISKGNIAGNEDIDGNICIQSTAPISPGSSGGPLLDAGATTVLGVNFAKSPEGENINYVIPAWRVQQIVRKHLHDQPSQPANGLWKRLQVQVPRPEVTAIEANEALYAMSGGCGQGVFVAKVGERSFFNQAKPPVPNGSFLLAVNGQHLDSFGMGLNPTYAADRVSFPDLFFMVTDLSADAEFTTCYQGKVTQHKLSMAWAPAYERGIRFVDEPLTDGRASAYELFGDISVMEMTVNHIRAVLSSVGDPGPARWLHPDFRAQPRLIVNYVRSGSYASDVVPTGAAVSRVNGHEVRTLEEFRKHFVPEGAVWTLETDTGKVAALMFNQSLTEQLARAGSANAPYLLTPGVMLAAKNFGFAASGAVAMASESASSKTAKRQQSLLSEAHARAEASAALAGSGGGEALAAGPLLAQRLKHGVGLSTGRGEQLGLA